MKSARALEREREREGVGVGVGVGEARVRSRGSARLNWTGADVKIVGWRQSRS
jgi:hypothetical protein